VFSLASTRRIASGLILHANPLYVQFYITARCNLTCQQCNIIYANSDVRECNLDEVEQIAANLSRIGVAIVLLTGGEPFVRKDLPEIVRAFVKHGIHVRMQTNGLASEEALAKCIEYGGNDISISLDTLKPNLQDRINGEVNDSWIRAIKTISTLTRVLPAKTFGALGCVLSPDNIEDVEDVVRFGTAIGWYTSLVPAHVAHPSQPMNFRTYDKRLIFTPDQYPRVATLLRRLKRLKAAGASLYDSDEYLDDIYRFITNEPTTWRRKNNGVCDSPSMYFAILPNGAWAVCCDHRLPGPPVPVYDASFPEVYRTASFKDRAVSVAKSCSGCMFGSYPEITITARYWSAMFERARVFMRPGAMRKEHAKWPLSVEVLQSIAADILARRDAQ